MSDLIRLLAQKTSIKSDNVKKILHLIEEGATVPFIARYRKEMTGGATDEQLREFYDAYEYSKKLLERRAHVRVVSGAIYCSWCCFSVVIV